MRKFEKTEFVTRNPPGKPEKSLVLLNASDNIDEVVMF
jgi:hypothetical protein